MGEPFTCLSRYSLEKLCFTVFMTLFNFQNFGPKLPAKIQLFTLKISQKTSYWEVMEQTKLDFWTIGWIIRKSYGKLELTITVSLNWPILQLRNFWQQHFHLQTTLQLTKVCKSILKSMLFCLSFSLSFFLTPVAWNNFRAKYIYGFL